MGELTLGITGIVVSVILFLIGYRKTVGAKKQRIKVANKEIEKILIRRIVLEDYQPSFEDLSRIISGKAREHKVRESELLSENQILNNVFTKIFETDFISSDQRKPLINRLRSLSEKGEREELTEEDLDELQKRNKIKYISIFVTTVIALSASALGATLPLLPELATIDNLESQIQEILPSILITGGTSLIIIVFLLAYYKFKNEQEKPQSKITQLSKYVDFEKDIIKTLSNANTLIKTGGNKDRGFDFIVEKGGKRILIELKTWEKSIPASILGMTAERLKSARIKEEADKAILVTPSKLKIPKSFQPEEGIEIMTKKELRNYFAHAT